jgi:CHASE2 domain-containing sensor protein
MSSLRVPFRAREWSLALLAAGLVWLPWWAGTMELLERPVTDLLLRLPHPGRATDGAFPVVVIDDPSIAAVGALPEPPGRKRGCATRAANSAMMLT